MKVIHHLHKRKRSQKNIKSYAHSENGIRILDATVFVIAFLFPATAIPQVVSIWINKSAVGISLITWISWLILCIPMIIYGIVHKEKPIIIMYLLWVLIHSFVIFGTVMYA